MIKDNALTDDAMMVPLLKMLPVKVALASAWMPKAPVLPLALIRPLLVMPRRKVAAPSASMARGDELSDDAMMVPLLKMPPVKVALPLAWMPKAPVLPLAL